MYHFNVSVHARSPSIVNTITAVVAGNEIQALAVVPTQLDTHMETTFEQTGEAIELIQRAYFEPDGSFVWRGEDPSKPWQLDGMLFDRDERLFYFELKGTCPQSEFDRLMKIVGWPQTALMFQLKHAGIYVAEETFRSIAEQTVDGQAIAV